jgi:hypothetical protein
MTMLPLSALLAPRPALDAPGAAETWFHAIAMHLLGPCRLRAADASCRLVEIEFYFDSNAHPDPFAHRDPIQASCGRWYFHRIGGSYRGGSFKGLDLTFGHGGAHGGILIRSLETPEGRLVVGPSLCVDYLLATTGSASVAALASAIADRSATDPESPLQLIDGASAATVEVRLFRSARVGLSLKRHNDAIAADRLARPYRFLTEPRRVTKGRPELIAALLAAGHSPDDVRRLTGSPLKAIAAIASRGAGLLADATVFQDHPSSRS